MDDKLSLWKDAWDEVQGEVERDDVHVQSVTDYLAELGPMPEEALLLGKCTDGLPLLLNLTDPIATSVILVTQFETAFLSSIATTASLFEFRRMSFGVVTSRPDAWTEYDNCVGVFPAFHRSAEDFILSSASWAYQRKPPYRQAVLVLLDQLDTWYFQLEMDAVQNLRWLLKNGAKRNVWVIATSSKDQDGFGTKFQATSPTQFLFQEAGKMHIANVLEPK